MVKPSSIWYRRYPVPSLILPTVDSYRPVPSTKPAPYRPVSPSRPVRTVSPCRQSLPLFLLASSSSSVPSLPGIATAVLASCPGGACYFLSFRMLFRCQLSDRSAHLIYTYQPVSRCLLIEINKIPGRSTPSIAFVPCASQQVGGSSREALVCAVFF